MKTGQLCFVFLLLVATTAFLPPVISADSGDFSLIDVYWGTNQPTGVSPGDIETLNVVLRYESTFNFKNLQAVLSLPDGFEAIGGTNQATLTYSGSISRGSLVTLEFPIFISPDQEIGNYTADLDVEYFVSQFTIPTAELEIPFDVTGKPIIDVTVLNNIIYEGKQEVLLAVSNDGDATAKYLAITNVYSSGASAELDVELLGNLEPGGTVTVPFSLFIPTGMKGKLLPVTVEVRCLGPENLLYSFAEALQLLVNPLSPVPALALDLDPRELSIGQSTKIDIVLENAGDHRLSEIELTLSPDNILKIFTGTVLRVSGLGPGDSLRVETEIYVPPTTASPTAQLTVGASYVDEDLWSTQSESYRVSILLRGFIEISLTDMVVIPSEPVSGSPCSITVTVTNIGTSTASAAYAIPSLEGLPLTSYAKTSYIGNIGINDPTTFTISLQVESTTVESITLPVTLLYMDNLRTLHNVTFSVPLTIIQPTSPPSDSSNQGSWLPRGGWLIGIVVVVVVAAIVLVVWRRGKKR